MEQSGYHRAENQADQSVGQLGGGFRSHDVEEGVSLGKGLEGVRWQDRLELGQHGCTQGPTSRLIWKLREDYRRRRLKLDRLPGLVYRLPDLYGVEPASGWLVGEPYVDVKRIPHTPSLALGRTLSSPCFPYRTGQCFTSPAGS